MLKPEYSFMNEIIGSLLMFIILTGLVLSVFFAARQYLQEWKEDSVIDREISLLYMMDRIIDEMKTEGESSSRVIYAKLYEPMIGDNYLMFSHPHGSGRVFSGGNVVAGRFSPMNCTIAGDIFRMDNGMISAEFSVVEGQFNLSDMLRTVKDGSDTVSINDFYMDAGQRIEAANGKSTVFSSPSLCSITYNITSPARIIIRYSMSPLSDYVKMEVDWW